MNLIIPLVVFFNTFSSDFSYSVSKIDNKLKIKMIKHNSWKKSCPVGIKNLRIIKIKHWGFNNNIKYGELIVHKDVVNDIIFIFKNLYKEKYPIYSIKLISDFNADDNLSMKNNNTSAFNCRKMTNGRSWSNHSYGRAIDINPVQNPYVRKNEIQPSNAKKYKNRNLKNRAIIRKNSIIYKLFKKKSWSWGGDWKSLKDYQHFEKK